MSIVRRLNRLEHKAALRPKEDPEMSRQVQEWLNLPLPQSVTELEFTKAVMLLRRAKRALRIDKTDGRLFEELRQYAGELHRKYSRKESTE